MGHLAFMELRVRRFFQFFNCPAQDMVVLGSSNYCTLLFVWLFFERGMDKLKYFWFAYVAFIWLGFFAQIFFFDGINYYFANIDSFFFLPPKTASNMKTEQIF